MYNIIAVVRPFLIDRILARLRLAPIESLQVVEVQGLGRQKDYLDEYGDAEFNSLFLPKVQISLFAKSARSEEVVESLVQAARSGRIGDGKVFILPVERAIDIQSYEAE